MTKSLEKVLSQIEKLQKEADAIRAREVAGVVSRIKEAIAHYSLTPDDLFGSTSKRGKAKRTGSASIQSAKPRRGGAPKYRGDAGQTWSGVGKRPAWFVEALAQGRSAEDLLITRAAAPAKKSRRSASKATKPRTGAGVAKYHDGEGRTWTGFGKRPGWFLEALAAGKQPEDLLVQPKAG